MKLKRRIRVDSLKKIALGESGSNTDWRMWSVWSWDQGYFVLRSYLQFS